MKETIAYQTISAPYFSSYIPVLIILACMMVAILIYIRYKKSNSSSFDHLTILKTQNLTMKHKLILLQINNVKLLLGYTPNQISTLYVFKTNEAEPENGEVFSEKLKSVLENN